MDEAKERRSPPPHRPPTPRHRRPLRTPHRLWPRQRLTRQRLTRLPEKRARRRTALEGHAAAALAHALAPAGAAPTGLTHDEERRGRNAKSMRRTVDELERERTPTRVHPTAAHHRHYHRRPPPERPPRRGCRRSTSTPRCRNYQRRTPAAGTRGNRPRAAEATSAKTGASWLPRTGVALLPPTSHHDDTVTAGHDTITVAMIMEGLREHARMDHADARPLDIPSPNGPYYDFRRDGAHAPHKMTPKRPRTQKPIGRMLPRTERCGCCWKSSLLHE